MAYALISLLLSCVALALAARAIHRRLPSLSASLLRPAAIAMGSLTGVALGLGSALALNPWVGLQSGTFHNLMLLSMCLAFLGLIVGSMCGLLYGGMILAPSSRMALAEAPLSAAALPGASAPAAAARATPQTASRGEGAAPPDSSPFAAYLSEAQRAHDVRNPGGEP